MTQNAQVFNSWKHKIHPNNTQKQLLPHTTHITPPLQRQFKYCCLGKNCYSDKLYTTHNVHIIGKAPHF
jgi:hypothetical protein